MKKTIASSLLIILLGYTGFSQEEQQEITITDEEKAIFESQEGEAVTIGNEKTEYEITITDAGFFIWLQNIARPPGYLSQPFLESRNRLLSAEYNRRVLQPLKFDPDLYPLEINYTYGVDYGYDVNYKLYYYFIFFQRKYDQRLSGLLPRL